MRRYRSNRRGDIRTIAATFAGAGRRDQQSGRGSGTARSESGIGRAGADE